MANAVINSLPESEWLLIKETERAALAALTEHGDEAKLLAGGMSLIPLMKLRLATPTVLVDVARLRDLELLRGERVWRRRHAGLGVQGRAIARAAVGIAGSSTKKSGE